MDDAAREVEQRRREIAAATRELSDEITKTLRAHDIHGVHNEAQYTHRRIKISVAETLDEQFRARVNLMAVLTTNPVVVEAIQAEKVRLDVTNPEMARYTGGRFENAVARKWMCIRIFP